MFPSEREREKKSNNFKNANSSNDLLAFMGREGSIQIKPVFWAYLLQYDWYLLLRWQKQGKHFIQITRNKDLEHQDLLGITNNKKKEEI